MGDSIGRPFEHLYKCQGCGKGFSGNKRRYCSYACRQKDWLKARKRVATCHWCKKEYIAASKQTRFCSPSCGLKHVAKAKGLRVDPVCRSCGKVYVACNRKKHFCSWACYIAFTGYKPMSNAGRQAGRARKRKRKAALNKCYHVPYKDVDIFERDGWRCQLCRRKVKRGGIVPDRLAPTIDHVIPVSMNGADAPWNVQCCCYECNMRKKDKRLTLF